MFERFNEQGRQVVVLALDEARSLGHDRIGSEHLLLGVLRLDDELVELIGDPADMRRRVVEAVGEGTESPTGQIPFSEHAKAVLLLAASGAGGALVGPWQVALALLELPAGATAAKVLRASGVSIDVVREQILAPGAGEPVDDGLGLDVVARRVLDTAARHADDGRPGPEHLLLGLVLEAPALTGRAIGLSDGAIAHARLLGLLEGPELDALAPRRDIAAIEAALREAAAEGRDVTPADLLLGLIEVAPDVVARAAIDLERVAAGIRLG